MRKLFILSAMLSSAFLLAQGTGASSTTTSANNAYPQKGYTPNTTSSTDTQKQIDQILKQEPGVAGRVDSQGSVSLIGSSSSEEKKKEVVGNLKNSGVTVNDSEYTASGSPKNPGMGLNSGNSGYLTDSKGNATYKGALENKTPSTVSPTATTATGSTPSTTTAK